MHRSKLFRALVIDGAMTAASLMGCGDESTTNPQQPGGDGSSTSQDDSTTAQETSEASTDDQTTADAELSPCFCNTQPECCEEVDGEAQAVDGFECCWGTSC